MHRHHPGSVRSEGRDLYHEEMGEGVPTLLIHTAGATASTWGCATNELGRIARVITYDRRGHARSGGDPARSISMHTRDAAAMLDALPAPPAAPHSAFVGYDPEHGTAVTVTMNSDTPGAQAIMAVEALTAVSKGERARMGSVVERQAGVVTVRPPTARTSNGDRAPSFRGIDRVGVAEGVGGPPGRCDVADRRAFEHGGRSRAQRPLWGVGS